MKNTRKKGQGLAAAKKKERKPASAPAKKPASARLTKFDEVVELMRRDGGATLAEIMKATGWQAHSVRGFIAGTLKKKGMVAASAKNEAGERVYSLGQAANCVN